MNTMIWGVDVYSAGVGMLLVLLVQQGMKLVTPYLLMVGAAYLERNLNDEVMPYLADGVRQGMRRFHPDTLDLVVIRLYLLPNAKMGLYEEDIPALTRIFGPLLLAQARPWVQRLVHLAVCQHCRKEAENAHS